MKRPGQKGFTLIELLFVVAVIAILAAISVPNFLEAQIRSKIARARTDMSVVEQGLRSYYADYNVYPQHRPEVHEFLEQCSRTGVVYAGDRNPAMGIMGGPLPALPPSGLGNTGWVPEGTSEPANARYSWTRNDPFAKYRSGNSEEMMRGSDGYASGNIGGFPILIPASYDLCVLTSPVAYIGSYLPADPFHDFRGAPYTYINVSELQTTSTPFGQQPGAFRRYVLLSYGPDTDSAEPDFVNPVRGPWISYDATNGTVSNGDLLSFGNGDAGLTSSSLDLSPPQQPRDSPVVI